MLQHFASWLAGTPLSLFIQQVLWIVPAAQTLHILAVAVVMSSIGMIDLRIFGLSGRQSTIAETADRYVPWIWGALVVLAATGGTLVTGEPMRSLTNPAFEAKMAMLAVAAVLTLLFQWSVTRQAAIWDERGRTGIPARVMALVTLFLWFAIAVAGRWIAYLIPVSLA
jgi:hypothetical protein